MRTIAFAPGILLITLLFLGYEACACERYYTLQSESRFGAYNIKILQADENNADERSCLEIMKDGVSLYTKKGDRFNIGSLYEKEEKENLLTIGANITGDGQPNLVISEYTGGAHCCLYFHVFQIGDKFRYIQSIALEHSDLADFENLDTDPALELPMNDWTFAYWETSFASSPAPKVIMKYTGQKYEMEPSLMIKPACAPEALNTTAIGIKSLPEWNDPLQPIPVKLWAEMLELIYTGNMEQAWNLVDMAWPEGVEGKQEFIENFKSRLRKSPFWNSIEHMNTK